MRGFGELESKIMVVLWSAGEPRTVRQMVESLAETQRRPAYTTVMTVMDILFRKGWLRRERHGRAFFYETVSSREHYVAELMRDALDSTTDQNAALIHFTDQLSPDEIAALEQALRRSGRHDS